MLPRQRFDYSTPFHREALSAPDNVRLIVLPVVNVEEWDVERAMPRQVSAAPGAVRQIPDMPNWTWHEYGMRVGFWRLLKAFEDRGIRPSLSLNAQVVETCPMVPTAARDAGWEFMAHCYKQMSIYEIEDQPAMIRQSLDVIEAFTGVRPRGWLGPGRTQTFDTLDYVAELGFDWFGDWILDDQPFWVKTKSKPLVSIPYSVELNDITIMVTGQHSSDEMLHRTRNAFDRLLAESTESIRVMAFGVHPYVSGAAHRIRYLEEMLDYLQKHEGVVFWTGDRICDWFMDQSKYAG